MGEHFLPDLSEAFRTITVSRKRALQLVGGAMAAAAPAGVPPAAEAGNHHQPPQAFVAGALVDAGLGVAGTLAWAFRGTIVTKFGSQLKLDTTIVLSATATTDQVRKQVVADLRSQTVDILAGKDIFVSEDRIAITLL